MANASLFKHSARLLFTAVAVAFVSGLSACTPFATYPPDGPGPATYPWMSPAPEVMATGLRAAHARVAPETPLVFNLPAGATKTAWSAVQTRLGLDARPMQIDDNAVVWNLIRYGIRNAKAFADIGYFNNGRGVLVTVSMERDNIMPYSVTHVQRWYVAMVEPVCNNPAPIEPAAPDEPAELVKPAP